MSAELPAVDRASASPFVAATAFEPAEMTGSRVTGTAELGPDQHTPWGVVHGGVFSAIIESAASIGASVAVRDRGQFAVGVNNSTDFLRPMVEGEVEIVAKPIWQGRSQQLWGVEIARSSDGKLIARGQLRLSNLPRPD